MGQGQSSGGTSKAEVDIKTSYYELLGIERTATEDEIKKAYRRKALELHPDRNHGREDETTKLFAEIQAANEVLSDPQERAWYDSHEAAILRGGDVGQDHYEGNVKVTTAEDVTAMIGKFNGRVRFDDSPDGFFGFLRDAFEGLAKEEEVAADWDGADIPDYPTFGHRDDTHDDVVKSFYQGWASFSTCKTFAWKDEFRLSDAPDRRVKRMMEKENKKFRDDGIREFNEAVRALVAFVRRRDPRYTPTVQTDAARQKTLREASAAQAARARAANAAKMNDVVPEWTKVRSPEDDVKISDDESEEEHFECVACHKTFKSEKQYDAHERSKKHQKSVYSLRKQMQKDNARLNLSDDIGSSGFLMPHDVEEEAEDSSEYVNVKSMPEVEDLDLDDDSDSVPESEDDEEFVSHSSKPQDSPTQDSPEDSEDDEDSDYAPRDKIKSRLGGAEFSDNDKLGESEPPTILTNSKAANSKSEAEDDSQVGQKKLGKAAQKRAKRAAKGAEAVADAQRDDGEHKCARCDATFPSKTKLFQHLKDKGHAAPITAKVKGKKK